MMPSSTFVPDIPVAAPVDDDPSCSQSFTQKTFRQQFVGKKRVTNNWDEAKYTLQVLYGHEDTVNAICLISDRYLFTGSNDYTINCGISGSVYQED